MKTKTDFSAEIERIENKIKKLEEDKKIIADRALNDENLPFITKFVIWSMHSKKYHSDCIPDYDKFPNLHKLWEGDTLGRQAFRKCETINILEKFDEEFQWVINPDLFEEKLPEEKIKLITDVMKEIMDANLGSFKADW